MTRGEEGRAGGAGRAGEGTREGVTVHERELLAEMLQVLALTPLTDLPGAGGWSRCPTCDSDLTPEGFDPTYDQMEKLAGFTLAQLVAFRRLQARSGIGFGELLDQTRVQPRPGIGAIFNPTVLGVTMHEMFIGIEPDGYAHS